MKIRCVGSSTENNAPVTFLEACEAGCAAFKFNDVWYTAQLRKDFDGYYRRTGRYVTKDEGNYIL